MTWKCFVYLKHAHCVQCVVLLLPIILDVKEEKIIGKKDLACIEERSCLRKTAKHVVVGYFQDALSSCQN